MASSRSFYRKLLFVCFACVDWARDELRSAMIFCFVNTANTNYILVPPGCILEEQIMLMRN